MARSPESKKAGKEIAKQISFQRKILQAQAIAEAAEREDAINRILASSMAIDNEIDSDYDIMCFVIDINLKRERR